MESEKPAPLSSFSAISYTWRQLAQRAGIMDDKFEGTGFEALNLTVHYGHPEELHTREANVIVIPAAPETWQRLLDCPPNNLNWLPVHSIVPEGVQLPFDEPIPVLFWGSGYEDGHKPLVELNGKGEIVFYADILATTFFMLSRWEEMVVPNRDKHDRFPATASVAYKQGFLDRPIVDEYAMILQAWLRALLPGWVPLPSKFSVRLSHDIDRVQSVSSLTVAADIIRRRSPSKAISTLKKLLFPERDPFWNGCFELANFSEENGIRSSFYFKTSDKSSFDSGYNHQKKTIIKRAIQQLANRGHEVGFHPGYYTYDDLTRFAMEKKRLDAIVGNKHYGGRQHYLRFRTPNTWRIWEHCNLAYDSSLGFADREGFRCGTCHSYYPYDIEQDRMLNILEIPLIVMDVTLKRNGRTPEEGQEVIIKLAHRCKRVNGVFTLLWHNSSLDGAWILWGKMYRQVLPKLIRMID